MGKFDEILSEIFNKDSDEYRVLTEAQKLVETSVPTLAAEAKTQMILLDHSRSELVSMYFVIGRVIKKLKSKIQKDYDTQYVRLVKLGRPSNSAIEAEIRVLVPEYLEVSEKIAAYEDVKELINSLIRCIDNSKSTAVECLRDSRRID